MWSMVGGKSSRRSRRRRRNRGREQLQSSLEGLSELGAGDVGYRDLLLGGLELQ